VTRAACNLIIIEAAGSLETATVLRIRKHCQCKQGESMHGCVLLIQIYTLQNVIERIYYGKVTRKG